jgi:4-amino-4-deoxy-L-arabinose transferase-like glycosyltransferase
LANLFCSKVECKPLFSDTFYSLLSFGKGQMTKDKGQIIWIGFAIIIVAVYFFGLTIPLLGPDEPRYSQVAREMFERGDWVTPTLGGFNWFEKPALLYWLQIVSYKIFGVTEFAARLGSAIFGLGTVFSLWLLGVQSSKFKVQSSVEEAKPEDQKPKTEFANWLMLISASSLGLLSFSRGASFDIILTFPIAVSLVAYFLFDNSEKKSGFTFYFLLFTFYFFIGIALLAKGLVGIVFPLAIVFFYHILRWELVPSSKFTFSLFWGIPLALLVASSWYLPMYLTHGWEFIDQFFIQHHFQRYTSNKYAHPQPFWFFWLVLPLMTIPWLPFFFASIYKTIKEKWLAFKGKKGLKTQDSRLKTFAFAWLLVPLVFFSLSGSKLPGYILPALPAACILTAIFVWQFVQKSRWRKIVLQILAFVTFAVVAILLQFVVPKYAEQDSVKGLIANADAQGYKTEKILNLHTISHNAEFYGANRLVREPDGKLKKFLGAAEIVEFLKTEKSENVLVFVPKEYLNGLTKSNLVEAKVLGESGEVVLVAVKNK